MFSNTRAHQRIPCDSLGFLNLGEERKTLQSINVSRRGACLRVGMDVWAMIEDLGHIEGRLILAGQDFEFQGRICWSSEETLFEEGGEREMVLFGIEFTQTDEAVIKGVLESLSILEEPPPDDSFNL